MDFLALAITTAGSSGLGAAVAYRLAAARARADRARLASEMQRKVHERTVECLELKSRIERVIAELDADRGRDASRAEAGGAHRIEELAVALREARSECQNLRRRCEELDREREQRVAELTAQLRQLEPMVDELERRGEILRDWERRHVHLSERQSELKAKLRAQLDQNKPLRRQLEELRGERSALERERDQLIDRQSKLLEREAAHAAELNAKKARIEELTAALRVDPQDLADYRALEAERDAYRDFLDGWLEELEELARARKREQSSSDRRVRELELQVASEADQSAARLAELELVRGHLSDREAEVEALRARCESIEREGQARVAGLAERVAELDALLAIRPRPQPEAGSNLSELMRVGEKEPEPDKPRSKSLRASGQGQRGG
jgi:DNA repair exonuclease SbcCD ATPase subunit